MARILPWLQAKTSKTTSSSENARPYKRQRVIDPRAEGTASTSSGIDARRKALLSGRSPSTSPPPMPPAEEFMHDGLDADDIYIMVEDEFNAIARTFTTHLHHAEYLRLKDKAKAQNASNISKIARPTDSKSTMSIETKKRKEQEAIAAQQQAGIDQILGQAGSLTAPGDDDSDLESSEDDSRWAGTSLHGLMTSPSKGQTSLTGLHGVLSNTRAAAGYSRRSPSRSPLENPKTKQNETRSTKMLTQDDETTETEDDDDLDSWPAKSKAPASKSRPTFSTPVKHTCTTDYARRETTARDRPPVFDPPLSYPPKKPNGVLKNMARIDSLDESSRPEPLNRDVSRRIKQRVKERAARSDGGEKEVRGNVNEIPIFLV